MATTWVHLKLACHMIALSHWNRQWHAWLLKGNYLLLESLPQWGLNLTKGNIAFLFKPPCSLCLVPLNSSCARASEAPLIPLTPVFLRKPYWFKDQKTLHAEAHALYCQEDIDSFSFYKVFFLSFDISIFYHYTAIWRKWNIEAHSAIWRTTTRRASSNVSSSSKYLLTYRFEL